MRTFFHTLTIVLCLLCIGSTKANAQAACSTAVLLNPTSICTPTTGNLKGAVQASVTSQPAGACGGATATTTYGVWYKFVASSATAAISINNPGTNITPTATYFELLSGSCGSFTSL